MSSAFRMIEQLFWTMLWIVLILVIFVFIARWSQNNNVPVLGGFTSWLQSHAGLEQ